jgi:hypothetical protein
MQISNNSRSRKSVLAIALKFSFIVILFIGAVFLINKIDFPAPKKIIEKIIPNENFKIVK